MLLPEWPLLSAYMVASLVLAATPGPGVLYIVTRSLAQGHRHGLASVAGVALGNLANALGASLGLAALFAVSAIAFTVVKYAGATYLVYLGIQALRSRPAATGDVIAQPAARVFYDGAMVALLNPKTALFFAAFLPQFMDAAVPAPQQAVLLGFMFVSIAAATDTLYALTASAFTVRLARQGWWHGAARYLNGTILIGLGLLAAIGQPRGQR